jgi:hypothetical protein
MGAEVTFLFEGRTMTACEGDSVAAALIATGRTPPTLAPFGLERFAAGRLIRETSLVVAPAAGGTP